MNYAERKGLVNQVETLMMQYCDGCFLHSHIKRESGRRAAHRFCISQCTIGEKIQQCGKKLS
ncbi:zinc-finger domain-containing protein [Neobacillus sp. Marseille-QA0830]